MIQRACLYLNRTPVFIHLHGLCICINFWQYFTYAPSQKWDHISVHLCIHDRCAELQGLVNKHVCMVLRCNGITKVGSHVCASVHLCICASWFDLLNCTKRAGKTHPRFRYAGAACCYMRHGHISACPHRHISVLTRCGGHLRHADAMSSVSCTVELTSPGIRHQPPLGVVLASGHMAELWQLRSGEKLGMGKKGQLV